MYNRKVLYITRNGMLEPLGQSQVLSYLKGLSRNYQVSLISFEKPEDRADQIAFSRVQQECDKYGMRWLPQRFHHRPKVIAPAWSMIVFLFLCLREVRRGNAELIHARSYIPAAVALLVNKLTGTPFFFDMRALWPEELITAGRLKRGSIMHKAIAWVERKCLKNAAAVISLTHAAVGYLQEMYPEELKGQVVRVIPTCADLDRFTPAINRESKPVTYSCVGTVLSGWFHLDWLGEFFRQVAAADSSACFEVVTRDNVEEVRSRLGGTEDFQARLRVFGLPSHEVHSSVQQHTVSAMFFSQGLSKLGSSPTRMGEILGCGLPVVANSGVGDVARIIQNYRVGVLVEDGSPEVMKLALQQLNELRNDPELSARCRRAAEEVFSLEAGTQSYRALYQEVLK
ncbi:glycosyltransferase [Marinobacter sp.]|uniref:glycosyltransferase n=1 Tax=Marinobacter sp. TaxID=50741 RepID=UPI003A8F7E87